MSQYETVISEFQSYCSSIFFLFPFSNYGINCQEEVVSASSVSAFMSLRVVLTFCFSAVCFFIYLSFRAVVRLSVQSTQFCSLLFYCSVYVLKNKIFTHSVSHHMVNLTRATSDKLSSLLPQADRTRQGWTVGVGTEQGRLAKLVVVTYNRPTRERRKVSVSGIIYCRPIEKLAECWRNRRSAGPLFTSSLKCQQTEQVFKEMNADLIEEHQECLLRRSVFNIIKISRTQFTDARFPTTSCVNVNRIFFCFQSAHRLMVFDKVTAYHISAVYVKLDQCKNVVLLRFIPNPIGP